MFSRIAAIFGLLFFTMNALALVFSITPRGPLPTSVFSGDSTTAYYQIENNTGEQRNNNFVKYLPPNVTQVTTGGHYTNTCGATFNLAPNGSIGDTCTLQLTISGTVNANDPNPRHHLFACFPGGMSCAGTNYPLNVTDNPNNLVYISIEEDNDGTLVPGASFTFHRLAQQQFTAIGTYDDHSQRNITGDVTWNSSNTSAATVSSAGLVTGATNIGATNLTASLDGITSNSIALTYIDFAYYSSGKALYYCSVNSSNGSLSSCTLGLSASENIQSLSADRGGAYVYYLQNNGGSPNTGQIFSCSLNSDGSIQTCVLQNPGTPSFSGVAGSSIVAGFNAANSSSAIYFGGNTEGGIPYVYSCTLLNGSIVSNSCSRVTLPSDNQSLINIAVNSAGTYGYAASTFPEAYLGYSSITTSGFSSSFSQVTYTPAALWQYNFLIINPSGTRGYLVLSNTLDDELWYCPVSSGDLTSCTQTGSGFNSINAIAINPVGTSYLYITGTEGEGTPTILNCPVNGDGSIGTCNDNIGVIGSGSPGSISIV